MTTWRLTRSKNMTNLLKKKQNVTSVVKCIIFWQDFQNNSAYFQTIASCIKKQEKQQVAIFWQILQISDRILEQLRISFKRYYGCPNLNSATKRYLFSKTFCISRKNFSNNNMLCNTSNGPKFSGSNCFFFAPRYDATDNKNKFQIEWW